MHKKNLIPLIFLLAFSCTVRPPLTTGSARISLATFAAEGAAAIDSMQGNGSVEFGQNGEHATVSFDIRWANDSSFDAQFSTPLGATVASVKARSPGKWVVEAANSRTAVNPDSNIAIGQDFLSYPVSWRDFFSILTGTLPCASVFSVAPDSDFIDKKSITLAWKSRTCCCGRPRMIDVFGKIDNNKQCLSEIMYACASGGGWTLKLGGFTNGHAKEFRFVQSNNNYFYVTYRSMKFRFRAVKRKLS
jgi:hypothetical protein